MARFSLRKRLGRAIRHHREAAGLSQEEFAARVGIHRTYASMVERGTANPSLGVIEAVAGALGTSVASLFQEAERISR